ncbi:hypothetical protein ANCCEY_01494 [Ancylostoma ceylanicum]|nr:hypothetical protein ANCCEY_01494 [Ancylostoma ceylanicum]
MSFATLVVLLSLVTSSVSFLKCYDTDMKSKECHPMQLWCVEWRNDTTVTRGCADVNLCPDEEDG